MNKDKLSHTDKQFVETVTKFREQPMSNHSKLIEESKALLNADFEVVETAICSRVSTKVVVDYGRQITKLITALEVDEEATTNNLPIATDLVVDNSKSQIRRKAIQDKPSDTLNIIKEIAGNDLLAQVKLCGHRLDQPKEEYIFDVEGMNLLITLIRTNDREE